MDYAPSLETVPQLSMITLQYDDKIDPPLREGFACMPIEDEPSTIVDQRLQFVNHLKLDASFLGLVMAMIRAYLVLIHDISLPFLVKPIVQHLLLYQLTDIDMP